MLFKPHLQNSVGFAQTMTEKSRSSKSISDSESFLSAPHINRITVNSRYLEDVGTIFYKFKLPEVQIYLHFGKFGLVKKSQRQIMVGESNQNVFLIQIDASNFAEFE